MSVLINENTKVIVQGITGKQATFHTKKMLEQQRNTVLSFKIQAAQSHPKTIDIS